MVNCDMGTQSYKVTITETLTLTVEVEAADSHEAEQIVSDDWKNGKYILSADNFIDVSFSVTPTDGETVFQ